MKRIAIIILLAAFAAGPALAHDSDWQRRMAPSTPPEDVFGYHDKNSDGMLSPEEFGNAYNFDPSHDCVTSQGIDNRDPRCQHHDPAAHTPHEVHIHIHHDN